MSQTVHTELSALATLYLTYLHCRPKTAQGDAEDTDMDNVSQELGLREGRRGSRRGSARREGEQGEGQDGEVHEDFKERNGEDDDEEESLQGISIQDGFTGSRPQAYSSTQQSQQRQQAQWQRTNQVQPQSQGQGWRPSTKPPGQQSPPPRQPSLAAEAAMQDRSGIESVNNYSVHSATESAHNGVPGSPVFLRGSRPHPSSSPLPRYMQAKGAGKR